jgi:hypothetical protein
MVNAGDAGQRSDAANVPVAGSVHERRFMQHSGAELSLTQQHSIPSMLSCVRRTT